MKREQFQGVILGLAVGDALGAPWEGLPAGILYDLGPADNIVAHPERKPLYYTDDTQMMIGVVQALVEHGKIEMRTLAQKFADNYHPDRGYGQGARRIINAIGAGEDWEQLRETMFNGQGSWGNGAAMRVAPLGLYFSDNLETLIAQCIASALPTHVHPIGIDGARLMALATALAARSYGQRFRRKDFLQSLRAAAATEEFQWQLDHALQLAPFDSLIVFGNSLEAHQSVMTSIMCFVDSPDSYTEAISRALGQGNDVDTLAAMAGALSGARLGVAGIPPHLIECLEDQHQGRTYLIELADQLWMRHGQSNQPA